MLQVQARQEEKTLFSNPFSRTAELHYSVCHWHSPCSSDLFKVLLEKDLAPRYDAN